MLSLILGIAVTAIAARLIIRNYHPQTVLLVAGLTLLTLVGIVVFKDSLSGQQMFGLVMAAVGIVCVTLGEEHAP